MGREEVSSPTVSTESTLLTAVIEAEEARDVATCDIPNAFVQTKWIMLIRMATAQ